MLLMMLTLIIFEMQYLSDRKEEGQKEDRRAKEKEDTDHIHSLPGL